VFILDTCTLTCGTDASGPVAWHRISLVSVYRANHTVVVAATAKVVLVATAESGGLVAEAEAEAELI
jgi:hypothetical protein